MNTTELDSQTVLLPASELPLKAIDWAIAKYERSFQITFGDDGRLYMPPCKVWEPTRDWAQGGPILQEHNVTWDGQAATVCKLQNDRYAKWTEYGPNQLIAGLRAILAWREGPVIHVPASLLG